MIYDAIIIGSGPAGLSAAIYGQRAGLDILVLERNPLSGGQILNTYEVDNYPGLPEITGMELGQKMRSHADALGASFETARVTELIDGDAGKTVVTDKGTYEAKAVVLAMGATHRKLGVAGEEELCGMGVSYCATCDGAFFRDRTVAVVGGGDVALEDAVFLARTCKKVYLIHRRDVFRGAKILQRQVEQMDNIEICYDTVVQEIAGEDMVENILIYNKKTQESKRLEVQGVFLAVGILPNAEVKGLPQQDEGGYIVAGEDGVTGMPGVFAAGDIRTKQLRQVLTAAADGANAITSVERYLAETAQ